MDTPNRFDPAALRLAQATAVLYLLALLTGGLAALGMSGDLPGLDGRLALGAHVGALMGGAVLLGLAYTIPMTRFGPVGRARLAWTFIVANYANWLISTVKAFLHVHGVGRTGDGANDAVYVLLNVLVVAPSLAGAVAWIVGLRATRAEA